MEATREYLRVKDVAQMLQLSVHTIYRYTSRGIIPHKKVNSRTVYFRKEEIEAWIEKQNIRTLADLRTLTNKS